MEFKHTRKYHLRVMLVIFLFIMLGILLKSWLCFVLFGLIFLYYLCTYFSKNTLFEKHDGSNEHLFKGRFWFQETGFKVHLFPGFNEDEMHTVRWNEISQIKFMACQYEMEMTQISIRYLDKELFIIDNKRGFEVFVRKMYENVIGEEMYTDRPKTETIRTQKEIVVFELKDL